jgi:hypothetical protein
MKGAIEIFHYGGSTMEGWLYVNPDETLTHHIENDGARFLRRGAEAQDERLSPAEACRRWPQHQAAIERAIAAFAPPSAQTEARVQRSFMFNELVGVVARLEDAAHTLIPAAASCIVDLPDDPGPRACTEELGELQDDLLRLRWLIEDALGVRLRRAR